ncbi:MAG: hypothetical protein CSA39_02720 [Flavobacteriales bacterium]|nr:MAG: hypothetical protein CR989_02350 [Flavobacteriales bacterium]PIE49432.1 MAG: hypothetical protein CSA39_02720 [Flavobacteriales bacterium]
MHLQIITPEKIIFNANVDAVTVPGVSGEFQMLQNHAPIVSLLTKGDVMIRLNEKDVNSHLIPHKNKKGVYVYRIKSGTVEQRDNKIILLAD